MICLTGTGQEPQKEGERRKDEMERDGTGQGGEIKQRVKLRRRLDEGTERVRDKITDCILAGDVYTDSHTLPLSEDIKISVNTKLIITQTLKSGHSSKVKLVLSSRGRTLHR